MDACNAYFWNYLELPTPVILSSKLRCLNSDKVVAELKKIMNEIKKTIEDLKQLNIEAATLSRLIYRTKHKLRQEKSFKALQKINRCLTNYLTMHLPFVISSIRDTLYGDVGPTRQMLEWALVRLLGTAHLFNRVYHLCVDAAGHLYVKIKLSHVLEITFFAIATVSRIWTFSQFVVRQVCNWYQSLHQYLNVLVPSPVPWLPPNCVLPLNIVKTLDNPHYLKLMQPPKPSRLLFELNVNLCDSNNMQIPENKFSIADLDDLGELIPRDFSKQLSDECGNNAKIMSSSQDNHEISTEKEKIAKISKPTKQCKRYVEQIKSYNDLVKFFKIECSSRNVPSKSTTQQQCLLRHLDELQWTSAQKFLKKQIKLLKKAETLSSSKKQEKLLKRVREIIMKWIS